MNTNSNITVKKLVMAALFAALSCVATMAIQIPVPSTSGYIHPGDSVVILSGIILGPWWGALAAGIGSAMADFLTGYMIYIPATLIIKGVVALGAGLVFRAIGKDAKTRYIAVLLGGVIDIIFVTGGYFLYHIPFYGLAGAIASTPAQIIQGTSGLILAALLYPVLFAIPDIKRVALGTR